MDTNCKRFDNLFTTARANLRRAMRRNAEQMQTSIFSFACKGADKGAPCCIRDAFGEMVVFNHVCDLQIFDNDGIIFRVQSVRCFAVKVFALIRYMLMLFGEFVYKLPSSMACFLASRYDALFSLQFLFSLSQMARVINLKRLRKS